jgi:hypothetical protein
MSTRKPRSPARRTQKKAGRPADLLGHGIHHAIEEEIRLRLEASPGGRLVAHRLGQLSLDLVVDLKDPEAGAEKLSAQLEQAVARFVEDAVQAEAAFRPGRAFCHRCESADCGHTLPPLPRVVFAGYTPTGLPRWIDFPQYCLDRRHEEVDRLYDDRPVILTLEVEGHHLNADLMPEFHRSARHHDVPGQVCAGLFPLPGADEPVALTFQAVVTRRPRGRRRVGLNVIGGGPAGETILAETTPEEKPWRAAVLWAQAQFEEISKQAGRPASTPEPMFLRRVHGVLQGLARRIERDTRGRSRRTRHAQKRHLSGERPTRKAIDDLRKAGEEACLHDRRNDTFVILGGRGRTHFFAPEGRLVSSVHYPKETVAKKIRLGLWKPAPGKELMALKERVEESTGE